MLTASARSTGSGPDALGACRDAGGPYLKDGAARVWRAGMPKVSDSAFRRRRGAALLAMRESRCALRIASPGGEAAVAAGCGRRPRGSAPPGQAEFDARNLTFGLSGSERPVPPLAVFRLAELVDAKPT